MVFFRYSDQRTDFFADALLLEWALVAAV